MKLKIIMKIDDEEYHINVAKNFSIEVKEVEMKMRKLNWRLRLFERYRRSGKTTYGINHNTPGCFGGDYMQFEECKVCPFRRGCCDTQNM